MKLFYYQAPRKNFGDDLNPWLWPKLLGDILDDDQRCWFVGIGTILYTERLPKCGIKHIFGSGYAYGTKPTFDNSYIVHALRGPLTANSLGVNPDKSITDSAVLIRRLPEVSSQISSPKKTEKVGFIPHLRSTRMFDWKSICDRQNLFYISPERNVEDVLADMFQCKLIICEAMHGAIVADSLRIPWIPVKIYPHINEFKWKDWMLSINMEYKPVRINPLYNQLTQLPIKEQAKQYVKRFLFDKKIYRKSWPEPLQRTSSDKLVDDVSLILGSLKNNHAFISDERHLDSLEDRYDVVLNNFILNKSGYR